MNHADNRASAERASSSGVVIGDNSRVNILQQCVRLLVFLVPHRFQTKKAAPNNVLASFAAVDCSLGTPVR